MPPSSTFTGNGDIERLSIHFSSGSPEFNVISVGAKEHRSQPVHQSLGEVSLASLQNDVARILEILSQNPSFMQSLTDAQPDVAAPETDDEQPQDAAEDELGATDKLLPNDISIESLTAGKRRQVDAVVYLLGRPDHAVESNNAGADLRDALSLSPSDWKNTFTVLQEYGVVTVEKESPKAKKSKAIRLDIGKLKQQVGNHFTISEIRSLLDALDLESEQAEEPSSGEENQGTVNGPNSTAPAYTMTARTRRAMEREPDPVPGYDREPRPHQFLSGAQLPNGGSRGRRTRHGRDKKLKL